MPVPETCQPIGIPWSIEAHCCRVRIGKAAAIPLIAIDPEWENGQWWLLCSA
jgi:hypothetical protein